MVTRIHQAWSLPLERQIVARLVARVPAWAKPDHFTFLGVAGALATGLGYAASWLSPQFLLLACAGLVLNWCGDSLDGTLARARNAERRQYGFFIDHSTDVLSQLLIFMGLGASPYMRFDAACLALLAWWLAALFTFIRAIAAGVFQISYYGIGPTEIRLALFAYTLFVYAAGPVAMPTRFGAIAPIDGFVALVFAAVFVSFLVNLRAEARRLAREDPPV